MAKGISKKISKTRTLTLNGELVLADLEGFAMNIEEDGLRDVTELIRDLDGEYATITVKVKEDRELSEDESLASE